MILSQFLCLNKEQNIAEVPLSRNTWPARGLAFRLEFTVVVVPGFASMVEFEPRTFRAQALSVASMSKQAAYIGLPVARFCQSRNFPAAQPCCTTAATSSSRATGSMHEVSALISCIPVQELPERCFGSSMVLHQIRKIFCFASRFHRC